MIPGRNNKWMKNPFDWVFDHGTRDVAEWVREHYFQNMHTYQRGIATFFREYQNVSIFEFLCTVIIFENAVSDSLF